MISRAIAVWENYISIYIIALFMIVYIIMAIYYRYYYINQV